MSVKEFWQLGLLQEVNRQILHPMGLAIEVVVEDNGTVRFGEVWDSRDDPDGMAFGSFNKSDLLKAATVGLLFEAKREAREKNLGWHVQPVTEGPRK